MGPFTVHVAAIGAWKESEWLEIQEACCDRFRQSTSNGVAPATALKAQGVNAKSGQPAEREAKVYSRTQVAARGCRKATPGP